MLKRVPGIACCLASIAGVACSGEITLPDNSPAAIVIDSDVQNAEEPSLTESNVVEVTPRPSPVESEDLEPVSLLQAQVENILGQTCGECHGANGSGEANLDFIEDLDSLVDANLLAPGAAEDSLIVALMLSGAMPPADNLAPTDDEIQQIIQFVNSWDGPNELPPQPCSNSIVSFDRLFRLIQADLLDQDAEDRSSLRYLTLANRHNARVCGDELKVERWAMSKLLNSLSLSPRIEQPVAIDEDELLYRVDIRDYDWDRDIDVDGQTFSDGWEAILSSTDYAIEFQGDEADFINLVTETNVPLLYADALLDAASVGQLYYGLLNIPDTSQQLLDDLLIDVQENRDRGDAIRAGTTQSGISRSERLVERHDIGAGAGRSYWQSFDFGEGSSDSIFVSPLDFEEGESETIFTLINGLQAYVIFDSQGNTLNESEVLFDTLQDDFRVKTAVSCMTCHSRGPLQVRDEVRAYAESSLLSFNADEREAILELYPSKQRLDEVVEEDREIYQDALRAAGVPLDRTDPISDTFLRFNRDMTLLDAAGDLGVSEELLRENLQRLDPRLSLLSAVTVDRNDFSALFLESICVMQGVSSNRPADDVCDTL